MRNDFLKDEAKVAITAAVEPVELRSSAEVVVMVRARSGAYVHVDVMIAALVGWFVLAFLLFSPWEFRLTEILIAPPFCGLAAGLLAARLGRWRRWLITASERRELVRMAARSAFVEKGIGLTRDRTGILVYISLLEGMVDVVADRGAREAVPADAWSQWVGRLDKAVRADETGEAIAQRLHELRGLLERALPRRENDVDELSNVVGVA
jgi:putative membrane protein